MLQILVTLIVLLLVAALLIKVILPAVQRSGSGVRAAGDVESLPYRRRDYLLTKSERSFHEVLRGSLSAQIVVFAKVRLIDLVWLPKGTGNRQRHLNRVVSKHVDFVLCDVQSIRPLLVIELDDASHRRADRMARDAVVDAALEAAGLPILHIDAQRGYVVEDLKREIRGAMGPAAASAA